MPSLLTTKMGPTTSLNLEFEKRVASRFIVTYRRARKFACRFTCACAQIAQLVEQRIENPRVAGSIPALGTIYIPINSLYSYIILLAYCNSALSMWSVQNMGGLGRAN